eukprot:TRINITY_DN3362_c0_g1_i12.p1 TRINITY_DN3362_c0_g1~~TRINITY_DN3362_c0_g1_i12.p1  ORF type:complete len:823 (+),score=213.52 TRINITY_DN3362_c0_g1_i12:190-2658(+)
MAAQQRLLNWCRTLTEGYKGVNIVNFHTSWKDGLAFCALVHSLSGASFDFDSLSSDNLQSNHELAFDTAQKLLGIPRLLDPVELANSKRPEQFGVMTYLGQFFKKYGAINRSPIKRTNTAPVAVSEDVKKELDKLQNLRERYTGKKAADEEGSESGGKQKAIARTVSESVAATQPVPNQVLKSKASDLRRESCSLIPKCHNSGVSLRGVKPVEWNGNFYHPDHFFCTTCKAKFNKTILNVNGEPYCEKCGRKAFIRSKLKSPTTVDKRATGMAKSNTDTRDMNEHDEREKLKEKSDRSKIEDEEEKQGKEEEEKSSQKSTMPAWRLRLLERKAQLGAEKSNVTEDQQLVSETTKIESFTLSSPSSLNSSKLSSVPQKPNVTLSGTQAQLIPSPSVGMPESTEILPSTSPCTRCKQTNPIHFSFCQKCGQKRESTTTTSASATAAATITPTTSSITHLESSDSTESVKSVPSWQQRVQERKRMETSDQKLPAWQQRLNERRNKDDESEKPVEHVEEVVELEIKNQVGGGQNTAGGDSGGDEGDSRTELARLKRELEQKQMENMKLQESHLYHTSLLERLKKTIVGKESEIEKLQKEVTSKDLEITTLQQSLHTRDMETNEFRNRLLVKEDECNVLKTEIASAHVESTQGTCRFEAKILELQQELQKAKDEVKRLRERSEPSMSSPPTSPGRQVPTKTYSSYSLKQVSSKTIPPISPPSTTTPSTTNPSTTTTPPTTTPSTTTPSTTTPSTTTPSTTTPSTTTPSTTTPSTTTIPSTTSTSTPSTTTPSTGTPLLATPSTIPAWQQKLLERKKAQQQANTVTKP